jgi:tetrapyrrole methylase family protein/MazG family protein
MDQIKQLERIMEQLRSASGCPWDRQQTHRSLQPYLLEESYEVLDAIDSENPRYLQEELGDLLFQVVFHAQLGKEKKAFTLQTIAQHLIEKLIYRHPHVFKNKKVQSMTDLQAQWEALKKKEKPHRRSLLDGLPRALPALIRSQRLHEKVQTSSRRSPSRSSLKQSVQQAWQQFQKPTRSRALLEKRLGQFLFQLAALLNTYKINGEVSLQSEMRRFEKQFRKQEARRTV